MSRFSRKSGDEGGLALDAGEAAADAGGGLDHGGGRREVPRALFMLDRASSAGLRAVSSAKFDALAAGADTSARVVVTGVSGPAGSSKGGNGNQRPGDAIEDVVLAD